MSDGLYLTQEMVEWLSQKKSEFLAWLIEHMPQDDVPIENYHTFDDQIEETILHPHFHYSYEWCDQQLSVFVRQNDRVCFVMISVEIITNEETVFYPLLFIPTKNKNWLSTWFQGDPIIKSTLH